MFFERSNLLKITWLGFLITVTTPAFAVFIDLESPNTQLNGHYIANTLVSGQPIVTESGPMELDFVVELNNDAPLVLDILVEEGDRRPYIAFSAVVVNQSVTAFSFLALSLNGAVTFANIDNVSVPGLIQRDLSQQMMRIVFEEPLMNGASIEIGHPDEQPDFDDWLIYLNGVEPGNRFLFTLSTRDLIRSAAPIPEPASIFLTLFGLGMVRAFQTRRTAGIPIWRQTIPRQDNSTNFRYHRARKS